MPTDGAGSEQPVVLVVDDERGLADLYGVWLDETCDTRVAYGGEAALGKLDGSVDIVFLDRRMPALSGDDVAREIRTSAHDCRLCMVTAVDADFDLVEVGIDDYLEKPVSQAQLQAVVDRLSARTRLPERLRTLLADISKLAAIEASKPRCVETDTYTRLQCRVHRQLTEFDPDDPSIDGDALVAATPDPDDDSAVAETISRLQDRFGRRTQVDG